MKMAYPKNVYHKDYNPNTTNAEKELQKNCRIVHSEDDVKKLGSDWGAHPSVKEKKVEKVSKVVEAPKEVIEEVVVQKPAKKSRFER